MRRSRWLNPFHGRLAMLLSAIFWILSFAPGLRAQESVFTLDPARTEIHFTLDSTLHTVHGTFKLKSGQVRFDSASGKASGSIVVDAASGDSNNKGRDKKMHQEILESQKFTEIVFTPSSVKGSIAAQGTSQVQVSGQMRLHAQDHDMTLNMDVVPAAAGQAQATTHFAIPYIKWGLKNPSTFFLHASDTVEIEIRASGQIVPSAGHP